MEVASRRGRRLNPPLARWIAVNYERLVEKVLS